MTLVILFFQSIIITSVFSSKGDSLRHTDNTVSGTGWYIEGFFSYVPNELLRICNAFHNMIVSVNASLLNNIFHREFKTHKPVLIHLNTVKLNKGLPI